MALGLSAVPLDAAPRAVKELPPVMLWAWEHPQDLRFLDPQRVGVAFLARTVRLEAAGVAVVPRRQPLRIPDDVVLVAVVRLEAVDGASLEDAARKETVAAILELASLPRIAGIQIDFDAARSQRAFYTELLGEVRSGLPDGLLLSVTALASWCSGDCWMAELPVDEIVPMYFRMGADDARIRRALEIEDRGPCPSCGTSVGVSTDEPWPMIPDDARVYVFHGGSWSEEAVAGAVRARR